MADLSGWVGRSVELGGKAARSLADEGVATTVQKIEWRIREEATNRRADSSAPAARQLVKAPVPRPLPEWPNHLTVVTPVTRSHLAERRLDHLLATARSAGIAATSISLNRPPEARRLVTLSNSVVLFQIPHSRAAAGVIAHAKQVDIPVFYMAVEPIFPEASGGHPGRPPIPSPDGTERSNWSARKCLKTLRLADHAIGGTRELAGLMSGAVAGRAFTLPYSTDESICACTRGIAQMREIVDEPDGRTPLIGYESLRVGPDPDLASISRALQQVLLDNPGVGFRIAGECDIPLELANLSPRVELVAASNFGERMRALGQCDIVVAPVAPTPEGRAIVEPLAHIHATELGIPVLVADTPAVEGTIDPRSVCRNDNDWEQKLQRLLDSSETRISFVQASRDLAPVGAIAGAARLLTAILAGEG